MPQASVFTGQPPSEVTVSSTINAPASRASREIFSTGVNAPVEVSACTMATSFGRVVFKASAICCGSMMRPHGASTLWTFAPQRATTSAKHAVDADEHFIARLDQIDEAKLHPRAAGAADGKSHFILGEEYLAEHRLDLFHHPDEHRVQMAHERQRHRLEHGRRDIARPRPHEQSLRRLKGGSVVHGGSLALMRGHGNGFAKCWWLRAMSDP